MAGDAGERLIRFMAQNFAKIIGRFVVWKMPAENSCGFEPNRR